MSSSNRKRDPWLVSTLKKRGLTPYKCEIANSHSFQKQSFLTFAASVEDATLNLVKRLSFLNKTQLDGSFWFAVKVPAI